MEFPMGIAANVLAVALGGIIGGLLGKILPKRIINALYLVFGFCAMTIGIVSIIKLKSLTIVVLSVILGCLVGELCKIETGVTTLIQKIMGWISTERKGLQADENDTLLFEKKMEVLCLAVAIVCFSGSGIFGSLSEGLDNDHSILLAKSVLDFFTLVIMGAQVGMVISVLAIPQTVVYLACFFIAALISQLLTQDTIANFKSAGGILTFVAGYNMLAAQNEWKKVRLLNLIPAFVLVILFSWGFAELGIKI